MSTKLNQLKDKLRELFQLDRPDLDFGFYRIMHAKQTEIDRFLDKDLLPQVRAGLATLKGDGHSELEEAIKQAKALGIDPDSIPKVRDLKAKLGEPVDAAKVEDEIYSHLYRFFSRYYDSGDFISMRRYKEGVYAIPYEGEEVVLHWANKDQYYIKSSENLRDYTVKLGEGDKAPRLHFKLVEADIEKDNRKAAADNKRLFIFNPEKTEVLENEVVLGFEYRADPDNRKQEAFIAACVDFVKGHAADFGSFAPKLLALNPTEKKKDRTVLEKHLTDYTATNTMDYFIHKDLGGFLRRELDFYIKNEVMHLDDIEHETAPRVEQYLAQVRVIRGIAHKLIDFLAQLEDFQKKLWLKKKFVVETNWCITLDRVPEELYPQIAQNDAQMQEWVKLGFVEEVQLPDLKKWLLACAEKGKDHEQKGAPKDLFGNADVSQSPMPNECSLFLLIDTAFYDGAFKQKLLAVIENIDEQTDGLLIHSENFQALELLQERYRNQVACIHIDPPYNTSTSGFLYKNTYVHSSWLAMMHDRINQALPYMNSISSFLCHIDENEYERLKIVFDGTNLCDAGTIIWDKRNPMTGGGGVAKQHEYIVCRTNHQKALCVHGDSVQSMLNEVKRLIELNNGNVDASVRKAYSLWLRNNSNLSGGEKAYAYIDDAGCVYQSVSLRAPEPRLNPKFNIPLIHPITGKPCPVPPNGFSRTPDTLAVMISKGEILFGEDDSTQPRQKRYLTCDNQKQLTSVVANAKKGKTEVNPMGLDFPYCHSVSFYSELLSATAFEYNSYSLDFFGGSGTTGHAVIHLNREDKGERKYILVEMGEHFDTVLKPRIQKVVYSADWKDGTPTAPKSGISHCFKYVRLESYEDCLNNLELARTVDQDDLLKRNPALKEDYTLRYMLDVESRNSLLNVSAFADPFNYTLKVAAGSVGESKPVKVDLVETFNYLIGLKVKTMDAIRGITVVTGENLKGEKILVLWRKTAETDNDTLNKWFIKQGYNTQDMEFDIIYVNGDNNLENLRKDEETWKVRLTEEEFLRRMFPEGDS